MVLFNDFEEFCCHWMHNLFCSDSPGFFTDNTPIQEISPQELGHFKRVHLFAGIGGWEYALRLAGWPEDWPVWTGSCPCQPFSGAGKGKGIEDERHLWPEMFRLIKECKPPVIFGEQVASPAGIEWMQSVQTDLEGEGYEVGQLDLCAAGFGAPHIRQRIFWVAYCLGEGLERLRWDGNRSDKSRRVQEDEAGSAAESCSNGWLDDTHGQHFPATRNEKGIENTGRASTFERVADKSGIRCGESGSDKPNDGGNGASGNCSDRWTYPTQGFWSDPDWLFCRDGKWRPVEPGTFPLAHGVPRDLVKLCPWISRVDDRSARAFRNGSISGYGNAIVPQVAAWFIKQVMEWINCEEDTHAS